MIDKVVPNLKGYLTVGEAAELLGVTSETLRNWDRKGRLRAYRNPLNGYRLYRRDELIRFLAELSSCRSHATE